MYQILPYTELQAKRLGVKIKSSENTSKKIDVLDWNGNFICSIGAIGYSDYPTYLITKGKKYADERRRLYKIRHEKYRHKLGSPSYYSDNLLW
jgi:hypothetical protein